MILVLSKSQILHNFKSLKLRNLKNNHFEISTYEISIFQNSSNLIFTFFYQKIVFTTLVCIFYFI